MLRFEGKSLNTAENDVQYISKETKAVPDMKTMVDKIIKFMFAGKIMFGARLRHILAPAATHNARAQSYLQQNSFRRHST